MQGISRSALVVGTSSLGAVFPKEKAKDENRKSQRPKEEKRISLFSWRVDAQRSGSNRAMLGQFGGRGKA